MIVCCAEPVHELMFPHSGPTHGGRPHWFASFAPHTSEPLQPLQLIALPQPSEITPHVAEPASAHVRGVQLLPVFEPPPLPHWNRPPPPQVSPVGQLPHWISPPQPSPIGPHCACCDAQVTRPQPLPLPASMAGPASLPAVPSPALSAV